MNNNMTKIAAGAAAVVAIGIGAAAVGSASSGTQTQNARFTGPPGAAGNQNQQAGNLPPGMGTEATGSDAEKAKSAALAKYPGSVERVVKLPDGGYVVHVIKDDGSGEAHVLVDAKFRVSGQEAGRGGPPGGGMMPPGAGGQQQPPPSTGSGSGSVETN
jgi:hypothetical protein